MVVCLIGCVVDEMNHTEKRNRKILGSFTHERDLERVCFGTKKNRLNFKIRTCSIKKMGLFSKVKFFVESTW